MRTNQIQALNDESIVLERENLHAIERLVSDTSAANVVGEQVRVQRDVPCVPGFGKRTRRIHARNVVRS